MKLDITSLMMEYESKLSDFQLLINTVKNILQKEIRRNKIEFHSLIHRIKPFDSFLDKIRRKKIIDPFNNLYDLVGLRIICLFNSDIELIGKIIDENFDVFEKDNKITDNDLNIFGYMSSHYKARLKPKYIFGELNSNIKETPFEIQIRTITQEAWASISHFLDYKKDYSLPDKVRRDFYALSGLFYVADIHFLMLREEQLKLLAEDIEK